LELAQARNALEEWRGILGEMSIAVSSDDLVALLEAPGAPEEEKQRAMRVVLPGATEVGYNLLALLARRRALSLLPRIQGEFEAAADALEGLQRVEVLTAVPLDDSAQARVAEGLKGMLGKEVRLATQVDASILGGMVLRIGDRVIDGSARGRLQAMRRSLAAGAA
jgi:F-type H+-transporting ATPase subunit delta